MPTPLPIEKQFSTAKQITLTDIRDEMGDEGIKHATMLYNRLIVNVGGGALLIHQTVTEENGFEVWSS